MSQLDAFERALAARNKRKAEDAARKNGGNWGSFPELPWSALSVGQESVVRLLGLPPIEGRSATDAKRVFTGMLLGDDDKRFKVTAPDPKERKNWILHKLINCVMDYEWDAEAINDDGRKGKRIYLYAKSHPAIFERVSKNSQPQNKFEKGWTFSESVVFNIIDRSMMDWHRENKKARILSKKASEPDVKGRIWYETGVPIMVYDLIVDDILSMAGNTNWQNYDLVIKKLSADPWYKVYHGLDDAKRITDASRALVHEGGLTEEEASWELNDLDDMFKITSYLKLKNHLGLFFQAVDKAFNKHFYEELCDLVADEEAEVAARKAKRAEEKKVRLAQAESAPSQHTAHTESSTEPKPLDVFVPKNVTPLTPAILAGLANGTYNGRVYKGVFDMTPEELSWVVGVTEDGDFVWKDGIEASEDVLGFSVPEGVHVHPLTGDVLK